MRLQQMFACCPKPWTMLYGHLVIVRKPLYYVVNLVSVIVAYSGWQATTTR